MSRRSIAVLGSVLFFSSACASPAPNATDASAEGGSVDAAREDSGPEPFALTSTAYAEGAMIPLRHECAPPLVATGPGENVSPALRWTAGPAGTMSYAIVMRDRDARNLVHWVVYDLSASTRSIAEAIPGGYAPVELNGGKQAEIQGSRYFGYFGPCSEGRVNTYVITVHALPTATLPGALRTSTENALATSIEALSIGAATLSGES